MALLRKKQYRPIDKYDEAPPSWVSTHLPLIFISIAVILIAATAVVIMLVVSGNTPVKQQMRAISADFDAGSDFHAQAQIDKKPVMTFDGSIHTDSPSREITLCYDAVYTDYSYQGVVMTQDGLSYSGNCFSDQWTVTDATQKVLDFFDFYTDFQNGDFDTGAFLRFLELTDKYSFTEFDKAIGDLLSRFSSSNSLTRLTVTQDKDGGVTYTYHPDVAQMMTLLKDSTASVFSKSSDYDKFKSTIELNGETIDKSSASLIYQIDGGKHMKEIHLTFSNGKTEYQLDITFSNFGKPSHPIPDMFYTAAELEKPAAKDD